MSDVNYKEFIQSIKDSRPNEYFQYSERHHIVPRCMGGTDEEENLIYLTYREHFIAHRLLAEENPSEPGLVLAFDYMAKTRDNDTVTPEEYELAKRLAHDVRIELYKDTLGKVWDDPGFRERKSRNSSETLGNLWKDPEFIEKAKERGKTLTSIINSNPNNIERARQFMIQWNKDHEEDHRQFMTKWNEEHKDDPEIIKMHQEHGRKLFKEYNERTGSLPIFKKVCKTCGKEFLGKKAQQYCDNIECLPKRYRPDLLHRVCPNCGLEFETYYPRKRFCTPECRDRR